MLSKLKGKKGFTLIEMLVVIAIIAILVAIIVPVVSNSTKKAKAATDAANLRSVAAEVAIEATQPTPDYTKVKSVASKYFPGATMAVYQNDNSINVYFKNGTSYYDVNSFSGFADGTVAAPAAAATPTGTEITIG